MSNRVYRLLRNNKEEGPFTSGELIQQNLKPYDLIWIDGRSAAWYYPGELPEFKNHVPLPGEWCIGNSSQQPAVSASVQAAVAINALTSPVLTQKPRYRVSAAWSKIQTVTSPENQTLPAAEPKKKVYPKMVEPHQHPDAQARSLSWEEAWHDWEKEKKITPVAGTGKTKNVSVKQSKRNSTPVLETKYSASLDDLKDQYIEHIISQKQKANKSKASSFIIPAISLLIIFSAGYWLLHSTNANTVIATVPAPTVQPEKAPVTAPTTTDVNEQQQNNSTEADAPATITINHAEERKPVQTTVQSKREQLPRQQTNSAATIQPGLVEQVAAVNDILQKNTANSTQPANTTKPVINNHNDEVANNTEGSYVPTAENTAPVTTHTKRTADYVQVPQRISVTDDGASLSVKNISGIDLDLIVIDVQYFDGGNTYRKGETMYLHHLKAGKNTIIRTPKDTNAVYAIAKVSLVSADAANISVIGDN